VKKFLSGSTNPQLSSSSKAAATISRFICNLVLTLLQEVDALVKDPSSSVSVDPLNDHLSPPALPGSLSSSWLNLFGGHSGAAKTFSQLLAEVLRTFEPPTQLSQAQILVARASLFSLHWSVANAVMSETSRSLLLNTLTSGALSTPEFAAALPFSSDSKGNQFLQGYMLTPKLGEWMLWQDAVNEISRTWTTGRIQPFSPYSSGVVPSDVSLSQNPLLYHMYEACGSETRLYLPSASSVSFQYMFGLSLRAGLHPVIVGHQGSGKRSLTDHLMRCWGVFGQFKADVIVPTASKGTNPSQYHSLLMTYGSVQTLGSNTSPSISPASWGVKQRCFRPKTGHQVVLIIQDLHVLSSNKNVRSLEWLRRLLDDSASSDSSGQGSKIEIHGVSAAFTTTPLSFVAGQHQVSPRLWRHMHHLHWDSSPSNSVFRLINQDHIIEARCHASLTNIATNGGMKAFSQSGNLNAAAKVLSSLVTDAITCTVFLNQARVVPSVSFNATKAVNLLSRIEAAAVRSFSGEHHPWTPSDLMLRLVYELGRDIGFSLPWIDAVTLSRVLVRVTGRELGAFIGSGKFHAAVRARDRNVEQKIKDLGSGPASTKKALHFDSQDETWLNDWQSSLDPFILQSPLTVREVLLHWSDYHAQVISQQEANKSLAAALVSALSKPQRCPSES
jgi:hypothetical protein